MRPANSALKHTPAPLAVVGAGAAGLFAAAVAADRGLGALVFERKARPAAKMLMTANGRCNFTKDLSAEQMLADLDAPVAAFARPALSALPPARIAAGFKAFGLRVKRMADGRLFPASEKAADVVHVLGDILREKSVPLLVNCPVVGVQPVKNGFIVATRHFTVWARSVLLATGGVSFPKTGSVGDGQHFAHALGHRIVPLRAGLVGYDLPAPRAPRRHESAVGRVLVGGRVRHEVRGELEFDRTGVAGAATYNCQRWAAKNLRSGEPFAVELRFGGETLTLDNPVPRPVKEAIVTLGGVALDEVDPSTMMSRKVPGLFFAGEVLDVDGPTGGYNLSLAFATARLAAVSAAAWLKAADAKGGASE